jgi:dihydropteroate synthase
VKCFRLNSRLDIKTLFENMGVTKAGIQILTSKSQMVYMYIEDLPTPGANILKQEALSVGADVAVPKGAICCETPFVNALVMATPAQFQALSRKLKIQPFGLKKLSLVFGDIEPLEIANKPTIMGVVNANEDSFFKKSRFNGIKAIEQIESMIADGAGMIDLGGVSSRPGSQEVSQEEELARIKPIIDLIYEQKLYEKAVFSLDSYEPVCIEYALDHGFGFINDITGLENDSVAKLAAKYGAAVCIMHMQGSPKTMQQNPHYDDVIESIDNFFAKRLQKAKDFGIKEVVLDVGIGFGKSLEHNLLLLKHHSHFLHHGCKLLIGASRKSMIDAIVPTPVEERLPGTLAIHLEAVRQGASIIRVHDVKEHFQALKVALAIEKSILQGVNNE